MQDNEKNYNNDEMNNLPLDDTNELEQSKMGDFKAVDASDSPSEDAVTEDNKTDEPKELFEDTEKTSAQELTEEAAIEPAVPCTELTEPKIYRWNYDEQLDIDGKRKKKKQKSAMLVYAIIVSCAFLAAFTMLILLIISKNTFPQNTPIIPSQEGEKVVYVREYDSSSGVLTPQEVYSKCLPSVVSIAVSNDTASGIGSGFIISSDGYIVTANHVVNDMESITVILSNNEAYRATLVDGNDFTDIALLKIDKTGLPALKIGRSSSLLVGENVYAIGTPAAIDFAGSFAEGVVSYNNRIFKIYNSDGSVQKKMTLIQTNALVNPGNSGCPLINERGEAVGIVTMKLNSTHYEGMCFAIPIDSAFPIIKAMKAGQNYEDLIPAVSRYPAVLGITNPQDTTVEGKNIQGVQITEFTSSQYDISRKMSKGDIIVGINDYKISSVEQLRAVLDVFSPGDMVKITFYRSTQQMTVTVILGK